MGFWGFLKKQKVDQDSFSENPSIPVQKGSRPGIFPKQDVFNNESSKEREHNIVYLFQFLDDNYEVKGYNDSLIYPDSNYLNQNVESLKNDLFRTIKKVRGFYEDFITEVDFHIDSRSRNGFVEMVEELKMKKKKAEDHLKRVIEIEENAKNNSGECLGITLSYTRGFQNGLAAISQHSILNRNL